MAKTAYEKVKVWRDKNHDKWLETRRAYNKRNAGTVKARAKRYKEKHKDVIRAGNNRRQYEIAVFLEEYKASMGCLFCGENFPAALDFHHMGDKEGSVSSFRAHSIGKVRREIEKCVLLCANCHRKLHSGFLSLD